MRIKSNNGITKEKLNLVYDNEYWVGPIISIIIIGIFILADTSWGGIVLITIITTLTTLFHIIIKEYTRMDNLYYYNKIDKYGPYNFNWFVILIFPLIILSVGFTHGIKPMWLDYNNAIRIDKELIIDKKISLFYNDIANVFILFIDGHEQPLLLDRSGDSESYYRLKAGYLTNKIKIIKKQTKRWIDDNSSIHYQLDGYIFD